MIALDIQVHDEMIVIIDRSFHNAELNGILKLCITEKLKEAHAWSELTLSMHYMLGGQSPDIYRIGACTELIMLALDIIDDLSDQDSTDKAWMKLPSPIVLNGSVALLVAAIGEIGQLKEQHPNQPLPLVSKINEFLTIAANGQHQDIVNTSIETEEAYLSVILGKSAPLIKLAYYMGYSSVESCNEQIIAQIDGLSDHLAVVAQMQNDLNDLLLFDVKNDLLHKKRTIPIQYLLSYNSSKTSIIRDYYNGVITWKQLVRKKIQGIKFIRKSGCVEYSKVIQGLYLIQAELIFKSIPGNPVWRERFYAHAFAPYNPG